MRTAFIETLCASAKRDKRIWLLCGDLGYLVVDAFRQMFPDRFLNVGIAEQNMTGIAAGLAMSGKIVFTYSIANFPTLRCLEQIRNDVCYHNANVKIVGVGGGLAYGSAGYSHHAVEDLAVMRVLPHMTVLAPGDPVETRLATRAIVESPGPCYLRIGKGNDPIVHQHDPEFRIGDAIVLRDGSDITLISTGGTLILASQAADALAEQGIAARVISMPTVFPLDEQAILAAATATRGIISIEEHGIGGLGSAVAEVLACAGAHVPFHPIRLPREPLSVCGSYPALRTLYGISLETILARVEACLGRDVAGRAGHDLTT